MEKEEKRIFTKEDKQRYLSKMFGLVSESLDLKEFYDENDMFEYAGEMLESLQTFKENLIKVHTEDEFDETLEVFAKSITRLNGTRTRSMGSMTLGEFVDGMNEFLESQSSEKRSDSEDDSETEFDFPF